MLKRIDYKDLADCHKEDTVGRVQSHNKTREFTPYIRKKKKEVIPIYPVKVYYLS